MASSFRLLSSSVLRTPSVLSKARKLGTRNAHTRRRLPYSTEEGLGRFLPPPALEMMEEYQDGLLERLNNELRTDGKAEAHSSVVQTVLNYCERKDRTLAFNYAVLALNNSFFLELLKPPPPKESKDENHQGHMSFELLTAIRHNYGDIPRLKSTFSAAALGMFTNGWVWLVVDDKGHLGVLPTFGPSTLLVRSRTNMGQNLAASVFREEIAPSFSPSAPTGPASSPFPNRPPVAPTSSPASGLGLSKPLFPSDPHARAYSQDADNYSPGAENLKHMVSHTNTSKSSIILDKASQSIVNVAEMLAVGKTLYPLLCIPNYEHAWMSAGFGVWGKEAWLKEYWSVVDWGKVSDLYSKATTTAKDLRF